MLFHATNFFVILQRKEIGMQIRTIANAALIAVMLSSCAKQSQPVPQQAQSPTPVQVIPAPQMQYPAAKLKIIAPREGQVLKKASDSVRIVMFLTGMSLGVRTPNDSTLGIAYTKMGQHIHVIVDSTPYMADFVNGQPFNVGVLAPGMHTIRAFPSFSWHESIKSPGAFATRTFYVGTAPKGKTVAPNNLDGPLLTYSRPKGTYSGDEAKKIMLDFYVSNAKIAPDRYRVKLWIDGKPMSDLLFWQAYYTEGLSKGQHTVRLQLTAPNGTPVPGTYNSPSETITVQ